MEGGAEGGKVGEKGKTEMPIGDGFQRLLLFPGAMLHAIRCLWIDETAFVSIRVSDGVRALGLGGGSLLASRFELRLSGHAALPCLKSWSRSTYRRLRGPKSLIESRNLVSIQSPILHYLWRFCYV